MRPDLIVCADTVHTMTGADAVTAVAVQDGVIAAIGDRGDVADWRGPGTEVLDLGTSTLMPGFTDSHVHPVLGARLTQGVRLLEATTPEEVRGAVAAEAARLPHGAWVLGWGLNPNAVGDRGLRRELLDDVTGGRPALLRVFDGHSALASTEALRIAGVDGPRAFDQQSEIVCDADGRPTGLLLEMAAMASVDQVVPEPDLPALTALVRSALADMAAMGIASAHAMEHEPIASDVYAAIEADGDLPIRLRCSPWCVPGTDESDWSDLVAAQGEGGRRWSVRGIKLFIDGTIDNGTAWLAQPDTCGDSTTSFWPDPEAYQRAVAWFAARGVPTATHAIGDRGVEFVLDALESANGAGRHRVEHVETIPELLVKRFAQLGVTASMQPTHVTEYTEPDGSDNWSRRLGPARAAQGFPTRDLRDAGVRVALGSDWPIADCDPRGILASAQLRRRGGAPDRRPIRPDQALTAAMALEGFTTHAAWSVGEEDVAGTIAVGKRADLTALALDPLVAPADELVDADVALTVVAGTISHRGEEWN